MASGNKTLTVETQLSFAEILANGLVFFTALTIRDYMQSNLHPLTPINKLPIHSSLRKFIKLVATLLVVAILLVFIRNWERKISGDPAE